MDKPIKLLQLNTVAQNGAIADFMSQITLEAETRGWNVVTAFGRGKSPDGKSAFKIGSSFTTIGHALRSRLGDAEGLGSINANLRLADRIAAINPDILHLHNLHGYYLNYPILFSFLREWGKPVFWSLHDCWAFTGHCASFSTPAGECLKWMHNCERCAFARTYPKSYVDCSKRNFNLKKNILTSLPNVTLLPVSKWLSDRLESSFLKDLPKEVVSIDVDTNVFRPCEAKTEKLILGVANRWNPQKGLRFFENLRKEIPADVNISLIGQKPNNKVPGINYLGPIVDKEQLSQLYSQATVFVNPSYAETYSMTNREALASGAYVVSRDAGGVSEFLDDLPIKIAKTDNELVEQVLLALDNPKIVTPGFAWDTHREMEQIYGDKPGLKRLFKLYESAL